jgi:hypothetical protein
MSVYTNGGLCSGPWEHAFAFGKTLLTPRSSQLLTRELLRKTTKPVTAADEGFSVMF